MKNGNDEGSSAAPLAYSVRWRWGSVLLALLLLPVVGPWSTRTLVADGTQALSDDSARVAAERTIQTIQALAAPSTTWTPVLRVVAVDVLEVPCPVANEVPSEHFQIDIVAFTWLAIPYKRYRISCGWIRSVRLISPPDE